MLCTPIGAIPKEEGKVVPSICVEASLVLTSFKTRGTICQSSKAFTFARNVLSAPEPLFTYVKGPFSIASEAMCSIS